jgi:hypothetical protein
MPPAMFNADNFSVPTIQVAVAYLGSFSGMKTNLCIVFVSILARSPWSRFQNRGRTARLSSDPLMLVGGEGEAGKHPGARAHSLVATACPTMVRGGVPVRAAAPAIAGMVAQRWTSHDSAVAIKIRSLSPPRHQGKAKPKDGKEKGAARRAGHSEVILGGDGDRLREEVSACRL